MQYLYLLESDGYFKIGIANDVRARIAQLSTGNPHTIGLVSCYGFQNAEIVERAIHQRFAGERQRGEWFRLTGQNIAEFDDLCGLLGGVAVREDGHVSEADIEDAEREQTGGNWYELVKVKDWYYLREMGWDSCAKKKIYIRNIGSLEDCKLNPEYSEIALRLESIKFDGKNVTQLTEKDTE